MTLYIRDIDVDFAMLLIILLPFFHATCFDYLIFSAYADCRLSLI